MRRAQSHRAPSPPVRARSCATSRLWGRRRGNAPSSVPRTFSFEPERLHVCGRSNCTEVERLGFLIRSRTPRVSH